MPQPRRIPEKGELVRGRLVGETSQDLVFDLGHGQMASMPKTYLIWLSRPAVDFRITKGKPVELLVKAVNLKKKAPGKPHIIVGHRHTDERPWDAAQRAHPVGSRGPAKVIEFASAWTVVDLGDGFWAWHHNAELSWSESLRAVDVLRRGDVFDVVVQSHDQAKRRIIVSRRQTEPRPAPPISSFPVPPTGQPEAVAPQPRETLVEGAVYVLELSKYERNPVARARCLAHYGERCVVCCFDPQRVYGPGAAGVIHVHHLTPLSEIGEAYDVNPVTDLRPVCPTCHAVIHAGGGTRSLDEVRRMLDEAGVSPA